MALKSAICDIVHYALRTRAHCQTMVLKFKLLRQTVCLPRFVAELFIYLEKEKSKTLGVPPDALLH